VRLYNKILGLDLAPFSKTVENRCCRRKTLTTTTTYFLVKVIKPVSSEISDLCKISGLLLLESYFASQSK